MSINTTSFEFTTYYIDQETQTLFFNYQINFVDQEPLNFTEKIVLPGKPELQNLPRGFLDNLLRSIHIALGISYYKLYLPHEVKLHYSLTKDQAEFWSKVYRKGLGEMLFRNNVELERIASFPFDPELRAMNYELDIRDRSLVGVGGGKDSLVSFELLKEAGQEMSAYVLESQKPYAIVDDLISMMGVEKVGIKRLLDEKIFQEYPESFNGHIPISLIYAFLAYLGAAFYDYKYIVVSNEFSSNFGNIEYQGETVNHQWSKSMEFEEMFQEYSRKNLSPDITYYSLLRPFYEIRIVETFIKHEQYFSHFSSCNRNFSINKKLEGDSLWCGKCAKCAFVFALLSAFLPKEKLVSIFKKNLYNDPELVLMYNDLLGLGNLKPFDCVGTFDETKVAMHMAKDEYKDDLIIQKFLPEIIEIGDLQKEVFKTNQSLTVPTKFRFLGMKSALILGYGMEGKIAEQYLQKNYPDIQIGIADKSISDKYLDLQNDYDIGIRSSGFNKNLVNMHYTTATNIFFSQIKNKTIGITGSKGKSTTTSLIFSILKEADLPVRLLGNIGIPMLGTLLGAVDPNEIFVIEISSYMLDDIEYSPNIAVIINLFPDHMTYHGSLENYYNAKKNIIKFLRPSDCYVYNPKQSEFNQWVKNLWIKTIPFEQNINFDKYKLTLIGEHNKENIKAAYTVAKLFDISDETIKKAIEKFKPLPHRLEFVGEFKGIKFYDDAISTTPESTLEALKSIPNVETIFLGGEDRGYDFSDLDKQLKNFGIKNVILFPESGDRILSSKDGYNVLETESMEEAVKFAYEKTSPGKVCLLSCASPSYSIWKNFEEKGDLFQKFVRELGKD